MSGELEDALRDLIARGRARWPGLVVPDEIFAAHVVAHLATSDARARVTALAQLHASDLYLACACVRGEPAALTAFAVTYRATVRAAVRRVIAAPALVEDVVQNTLVRLLLPRATRRHRLAGYAGRVALARFVRAVAVRVALSALRREPRDHVGDVALASLADERADPAQRYLAATATARFHTAFATALASLSSYDRDLLRLRVVERRSLDELVARYGRPRSTIGRHVLAARRRLVDATRAALRDGLALDAGELADVLRQAPRDLAPTLRGLLQAPMARAAV